MHFARKFSRVPQGQETALLNFVSIYENASKKLPHLLPKGPKLDCVIQLNHEEGYTHAN